MKMNGEKMLGKWAQQDLDQKSVILQTLYRKMDQLSTDKRAADREQMIDFLASCLRTKSTKEAIVSLFSDAFAKKITAKAFEDFFAALKPLDAKLIPLNCDVLGIQPWPDSKTAQHFPEDAQVLLQEYMRDSDISAALSFRNSEGQFIDITPSNVYPIHSVAKVFTGVLALMMVHEKPDGENSILPEANLDLPIKAQLDSKAWALLPGALKMHIETNKVTLHQLMTHQGGLGDYGYDSGTGTYRDKLESGESLKVSQIRYFLKFAEKQTYPVGQFHYSNLGITLTGLAVENAYKNYQQTHRNILKPLHFFGMLKHYILKPAQMSHFFERAPQNNPTLRVQTNPTDKAALDWVGGPAGGYWTTTDNLVKFGQWLYKQCKDSSFRDLIERYGQEFHENGKISHPGNSPYASAFFFVDLNSGNTAALGSSNSSGVSLALELTKGTRIFTNVTEQFRKAVAQERLEAQDTSEHVSEPPDATTPSP